MRPTKRTTAAASETAKKEAVKLLISMAAEKTVAPAAVDANVVVLPIAASPAPALPAAATNEDHIIEDEDDDDDEEESTEKCRVCTISSSCFSYYNIFERMIFKNVAMADALAMITSLDIRPDDQLPPTICCRCEQRLLDAYHFRKLASSSARTFQRTLGIAVNGKATAASKVLSSHTTAAVKREAANNRNTDAQFEQFAREQLAVAANFTEDNDVDDEDDAAANTLVDIIAAEPNGDDATGMEYTDEHGEAANVELEVGEQVDSFKIVYDADGGNDEDDDAVTFLINYATEGSNDKRQASTAKQSPTVVESIAVSSKPKKQSAAAAATPTPTTRPKSQRQVINVRTPAADSAEYLKRKHKCEVCDKRFIGRSNLVDHLRQHANVRPYQCDHCDKAFVQKGSLICHMRTHTLERPFACNVCDKTFSQASSRQIHMRIHTQERCYVCPKCEKGFFSNSDLCKHKRTHDAVMAYACPHCPAGFAQRSNLKKHMMRKHAKEVAAAAEQ